VPFVQESAFHHHTDLRVDLQGVAKSTGFGFPGAKNLPDVARTTRDAGSWLIKRQSAGDEGEGWQDWPAEHRHNADDIVRRSTP
jgi:hypothetical protein